MLDKIKAIISNRKVIVSIYLLFALASSIPSLNGSKTFEDGGPEYTRYNNYRIFERSFEHLKNNQNLYVLYPQEHWDLYKYTPSFSVFFAMFNSIPDWLGLNLWNLLNSMVLLAAIYYLPKLNDYQKGLILLIVLLELTTSMQNHQSNALIAGLIVFLFGLLERSKHFWAALPVIFSVFIKLFGMVALALFIFYPQKWKSALYSLFWALIIFLLPLFFVDLTQYIKLLHSFFNMLKNDHENSYGLSVMGWLHTWFELDLQKNIVVCIGIFIFLVPFYKLKHYKVFIFRYFILCSVLIWIVIFNHKAESPTFIIAMVGVALWYVMSEKNSLNTSLFITAFILTSISPTDLFPRSLRDGIVIPYVLKVVPIIFIWVKIIFDTILLKLNPVSQEIGS
jgi:hypothetical protein